VLPFIFALFLSTISSEDSSICQNREVAVEETLYKEILLSSNDFKVKRKYLEKFGHCFQKTGINLIEIKNIPVLEMLDCEKPLKRPGSDVFFSKDGTLCSRSVMFFPSRKVFTINESAQVSSVSGQWKNINNGETILFYNSGASFEENADPSGRKLRKSGDDHYTDQMGKPEHPQFIYESGDWKTVYPLRETFDLRISDDRSFEINMITESPVSYEPEKLIETTGLKASGINIETPVPSNYFIRGKNIKGVRIPRLVPVNSEEGYHGTYVIRITHSALNSKTSVNISEKNYSISASNSAGKSEFILTVKQKKLTSGELTKILAVLQKQIPSFYIVKENDKQ
jgi:hypothetical protein